MIRRYRHLLLFVVLAASIAVAAWFYTRPKPIDVLVETVSRGLVERTVANTRAGTVKACRRAKLSPSIGGQIALLDVEEGDRVKAGQLLLELWNRDLLAEVELTLRETQAADARAKAACLNADVAQREADRLVKLHRKGVASIEQTDKAVTEAKANKASCEAAQATAQVNAARIDVARARLQRTRLLAPFDGVIAEINGELNEYVTPSPVGVPTPPAIDLVDNNCFYVTAPIDEVDAPGIAKDMRARITMDAFGDLSFEGKVQRVADYVLDVEKQARTVDVEVEFSNPGDIERLLAGYSADIEIILDVHKEALRVPSQAVVENERVYVLQPETGLLQGRRIETGMSNWDYTEILGGVAEGDLVVTSVDRAGVEDGAHAKPEE